MRWKRKIFFWIYRSILTLCFLLMTGTFLLYETDIKTLRAILPGVRSSAEIQEFCDNIIYVGERIPEDESAAAMVTGMAMTAAVGVAAKMGQSNNVHDQVISQYTVALLRARLLADQGDFSELEYELYKLPFKTGWTEVMRTALPFLQERVQLPRGFMS